MRDYKVWFNDPEEMKNHSVKVKAMGIIAAIDEAKRVMLNSEGLKVLGWDIWKAEMM